MYRDSTLVQSTEQDDILRTARDVLVHTFFSERVEQPLFTQTWTKDAYDTMPDWFSTVFPHHLFHTHDPRFDNTVEDITHADVAAAILDMAPRKAGGPSGVTADMLKLAPPAIHALLASYMTAALQVTNS